MLTSAGVYAVPLSKGKVSLISAADVQVVRKFNWSAQKIGKYFYACACVNGRNIHMHRFLLNPSKNERVDHRNGDTLNNCRNNLRICTASENSGNMKAHADSSSKYKGVTYNKRQNSWMAQLTVNRKRVHCSYHKDPIDAAEAYDRVALKHFGEFARINFPVDR